MRKRADACEECEWAKGLTWQDRSESDSHLNYYSKRNQAELGALLFGLSSAECHIDLRILASLEL